MFGNLFIQPLCLIDDQAGHWILGCESNSLKMLKALLYCPLCWFSDWKPWFSLILMALWGPWPSVEAFRVLPSSLVTYSVSVVPRPGPCFIHYSGLVSSTSEKFPYIMSLIISSPLFFLSSFFSETPIGWILIWSSMSLIYWLFFLSVSLSSYFPITLVYLNSRTICLFNVKS